MEPKDKSKDKPYTVKKWANENDGPLKPPVMPKNPLLALPKKKEVKKADSSDSSESSLECDYAMSSVEISKI